MKDIKIESYVEYEGMIHQNVIRYKVTGVTFGLYDFVAGPFQTVQAANAVVEALAKNTEMEIS